MERISKSTYYLKLAGVVSERGTCLRRNFGAILVRDDMIISTGYTGPPRDELHCNVCERERQQVKPGTRYELCRSVHAELNAIINAARAGVTTMGATMYIDGFDPVTRLRVSSYNPCMMCARAIKNAGIVKVIGYDYVLDEITEWDGHSTYVLSEG